MNLFLTMTIGASIHSIMSFEEAKWILKQCDKDTLVLFDIDETIGTFESALAQFNWPIEFRTQLIKAIPRLENPFIFQDVYEKVKAFCEFQPIEPIIEIIINQLKDQGATTLGLTNSRSGHCNHIGFIPMWRTKQLEKMGIKFSARFGNSVFKTLPAVNGSRPMLFNGIIYTNRIAKGPTLAAFCNKYQWKPKSIVFFDDLIENIHSVKDLCEHNNITYHLFHYKGADFHFKKIRTKIGIKQIQILMQENRWPTEDEVETILSEQKSTLPPIKKTWRRCECKDAKFVRTLLNKLTLILYRNRIFRKDKEPINS